MLHICHNGLTIYFQLEFYQVLAKRKKPNMRGLPSLNKMEIIITTSKDTCQIKILI